MTNLSSVKTILTAIVNSCLGTFGGTIQKDIKNVPKSNLFVRINMLGLKDVSLKPIVETNKTTGTKKVTFSKKITFSINSFGTNAVNVLYDLQNKLQIPSISELFRQNNISLLDQGEVKDLPVFEADNIKEHGNLDIILYFKDELIDDIGYFDKVELKGEFLSFSSELLTINQTVTNS